MKKLILILTLLQALFMPFFQSFAKIKRESDFLAKDKFVEFASAKEEAAYKKAYLSYSSIVETVNKIQYTETDVNLIISYFINERGLALHYLKKMIDYDYEPPHLAEVLFLKIKDNRKRKILLDHFKNEAIKLKNQGFDKWALASDIDDTIYPSTYDILTKYEKGKNLDGQGAYQGLKKFHQQFDYLIFVTARPQSENLYKKTQDTLLSLGINPHHTLAMGNLWGIWWAPHRIEVKVRTLVYFSQIYPEYKFLWIGDTSEGDFLVGKEITKYHKDAFPKVFIHKIKRKKTHTQKSLDIVQHIKLQGFGKQTDRIKLFKSYEELNKIDLNKALPDRSLLLPKILKKNH